MKHELKTWPCYFEQILSGNKTFEIRNDRDRGFQKGDLVVLREFDPETELLSPNGYTGKESEG